MGRKNRTGSSQSQRTAERAPSRPEAPRLSRWRRWPYAAGTAALVIAIVAGAWHYLARAGATTAVVRTPDQNVLLITIDTLRADAPGFAGGRAATPNLDRLAALGTWFEYAHAHAVITLPSHASILTGLYPYQHGIHDNAGFRLRQPTPTLASLLRAKGMATGAFIGAFALDSRFGLNVGFQVYDERYGRSDIASGFNMPERRADAVVASATAWMAKQQGPWFAWVHVFDPHAPYEPPEPFKRQYADQPYYGEVAFTDWALGPLLDAARDPSGRPTLVVVTGDHGEGLGDHGEQTHGLFAYEATLRIPLVIAQIDRRAPAWAAGASPASPTRASTLEARHVDIVPTILDALRIPDHAGLPGRSLLTGATNAGQADRTSYFEALSTSYNRGWAPLTGVLSNHDKLIDLPLPEMYDLHSDPAEAKNLFDRGGERRRVLEGRLRAFAGDPARAAGSRTESAETMARLQALGYVSGNAARKTRYTEDDDPKRLVGVDRDLRRAVELYEQHRPAEAVSIYNGIIAARPTMEVAYTQLAMLQWEMGQPQAAIATLRASMKAVPPSDEVRAKLGTYLAETGKLDEAIALLRAAVDTDANNIDARNALGIALARSNRPEEARRVFEQLLEINPSDTLALENLGAMALGRKDYVEARRYFTAALDEDPASAQANNGLGVVELKGGNRAAAIERFRAAVAADAENYDALYNLATELLNDGQPEAARPYLERFVRVAPPAFYARDIERMRQALVRMSR